MKKRCALLIALFLFFIPAAWAEQVSITLIHINDLHAHILPDRRTGSTGMAVLSSFLKEQRGLDPDLLFLDAGDLVTGSAIDSLTRGEATYELYDTLSPDAHVLGNHAFDHGLDVLFRNLSHARFPVLCANYPFSQEQRERIRPYLIVERKGLRIAILGLTIQKRVKGIDFPEDPLETASRLQDKLNKEADLTIALTHLGVDTDVTLAEHVPTLDIIVGGHSHTSLVQPRVVGNTYILQAGAFGEYAGKVRFTFDSEQRRITAFDSSLAPLDGKTYPADPKVVASVLKFYAGCDVKMDEPVAEVDRDYSRTFVADLVVKQLWTRYRPDFSLVHLGGFREPLAAGTLYRDDLYRIFPFDNSIVKFSIPASALTESLFTTQHTKWHNEPPLISHPPFQQLRKYRDRDVTLAGSNYVVGLLEKALGRTLITHPLDAPERSILEQALADRFPLKAPEARAACLWERLSVFHGGMRVSDDMLDAR
ncbi:MAG: bifunctional metallophosphatase/5'-nucleotidase [Deltaproteobacteria bacterium]|nr:bifunctional metallophosphatase/5'-nucleotidase [Deltaproteobacteria bacterium]